MSFTALEALTNATIGLLISIFATYHFLPMWDLHPSGAQSVSITAMFFGISFIRSYFVRLFFKGIGS